MIELFGIIATTLAVTGVILNNHRLRLCFVVWLISNAISAVIHAHAGLWSLMSRDVIFMLLAVHGWRLWSRTKPRIHPDKVE